MVGELYDVDLETLDRLDKLERHPTVYTRDELIVTMDSSPVHLVKCETYFMRNFRKQLLKTETFLSNYTEDQGHRYVPLKDRPAGVVIDVKESHVT